MTIKNSRDFRRKEKIINFEIFEIKRLNKRVNIELRIIYTIVKKNY